MAKDNLLKDAIADAKAVKEVAIANAMLTLKEAFKPQLTSMLAAKLRNEEDATDSYEENVEEQKKLDSSDIGGGSVNVDDPAPKEPASAAKSSSDIDNPGQEEEPFGKGDAKKAVKEAFDSPDGDLENGAPSAEPGAGDEGGAEDFGSDDMGGEEHGGDDDLDLEAIIRELEADILGHGGEEHGAEGGHPGMEDEVEEPFGHGDAQREPEFENSEASQTGQKGKHGRAGQYADNDERQDETLAGDWDGQGNGKAPASKDGVPGGKEVSPGAEVSDDPERGDTYGEKAKGSVDEEVDLDEILREMAAEDADNVSEGIATENAELKRSLREHREVIKLLRNRINEVTLLNSKLMYTTKIFRKFNLSEGQKKKVVEQLDRAGTLREAKIVFSTLAETLLGKTIGGNTSRTIGSKITEGASKAIGSTKSKSQSVLTEGDTQVARMQKLAGILRG